MRDPEDHEFDSEQEGAGKLSEEVVIQKLMARGYTEIDFELMEMRANRYLEEAYIQGTLSQFKFDFSRLGFPKES